MCFASKKNYCIGSSEPQCDDFKDFSGCWINAITAVDSQHPSEKLGWSEHACNPSAEGGRGTKMGGSLGVLTFSLAKGEKASNSVRDLALRKAGKAIELGVLWPPYVCAYPHSPSYICTTTRPHKMEYFSHPSHLLIGELGERRKGERKEGGTEWGLENVGRIFEELQILKGLSVCRDNCIPL